MLEIRAGLVGTIVFFLQIPTMRWAELADQIGGTDSTS